MSRYVDYDEAQQEYDIKEHLPFIADTRPDLERRTALALGIARRFGGIDGAHHKDWCIDQIVRALTEDNYEAFVANANAGEDGPDTYTWEVGIAP